MKPQNAAALVAAGMVFVLVYPVIGLGALRQRRPRPGRGRPPIPGGDLRITGVGPG